MKIFQIIQRYYATLGICTSSNQWTQENLPSNKRVFFGFLLSSYLILSQFLYIFCVANDFMEYMACICSTSASIIICVSFAGIVYRETTLFKCIDRMEELIDSRCKYSESKAFFLKTNRQVERLSEIVFMVLLKIILQFQMLPKCITSFGVYLFTDSGRDSFQLPYPMWFPFDTNNPIGYSMAFVIEYIILGYEYVMIACSTTLGIGAFWFAISAIKEFRRLAPMINHKAKAKAKAKANARQSNDLGTFLTEFLHAHGIVKQIEHDFSDIFQPAMLSLFLYSLIAISAVMLIIQMEILNHDNGTPLYLLISCGLTALILVFIACELGQRMSEAFEKISFTLDQWDWYLFPIEIKRTLPMIISIANQPVEMECFGSIACTRVVFKNILHHAYSCFMVLRHLVD